MKITHFAVLASLVLGLGAATGPAAAFDPSRDSLSGYGEVRHDGWRGDRHGRGYGDRWDRGPRHGYGYRMGWHEIRHAVRAQGFRRIHDIEPRGPHYRVSAINHRGQFVRLRVNGFNGAVMAVRVIGGGWGGGYGDVY